MQYFKENKFTLLSNCLIAITLIWVSANLNWGDGRWNKIINGDDSGYYSYLPAILIYQGLSFSFIDNIVDDSLNSSHYCFFYS